MRIKLFLSLLLAALLIACGYSQHANATNNAFGNSEVTYREKNDSALFCSRYNLLPGGQVWRQGDITMYAAVPKREQPIKVPAEKKDPMLSSHPIVSSAMVTSTLNKKVPAVVTSLGMNEPAGRATKSGNYS